MLRDESLTPMCDNVMDASLMEGLGKRPESEGCVADDVPVKGSDGVSDSVCVASANNGEALLVADIGEGVMVMDEELSGECVVNSVSEMDSDLPVDEKE